MVDSVYFVKSTPLVFSLNLFSAVYVYNRNNTETMCEEVTLILKTIFTAS